MRKYCQGCGRIHDAKKWEFIAYEVSTSVKRVKDSGWFCDSNNIDMVKCAWCGENIDVTRARTDKKHAYFRRLSTNQYFHKKCFSEYDKSKIYK